MSYIFRVVVFLACLIIPIVAFASPKINFTDLTSGPNSGLGDGLGSGAIVTIWGQNLGSSQGNSTITIGGQEPAYIYYWKNADGTLPGGPADLYTSHQMQEIAFSIPSTLANGTYDIIVNVAGETSNSLPFTVRSGNIYHAKVTGSPGNSGSFSSPFLSVASGGLSAMQAGDILYLHDGTRDTDTYYNKYGFEVSGKVGTLNNQLAIVTYPNSRYTVTGDEKGIDVYNSDSIVISKLSVNAGHYNEPAPNSTAVLEPPVGGTGIRGTKNGRIIGNEITDSPGKCNSGWGGAVTVSSGGGTYNYTGNIKILGNYIHDWGCPQTTHFEHTTYVSIRNNGTEDVEPWEMGWNHLRDNDAKYGIHNYDETYNSGENRCGSPTGTVNLHHNYIINQKGPGISIGAEAPVGYVCWDSGSFEVYNNVIINAGNGPEFTSNHGVEPYSIMVRDSGMSSPVHIFNNTIYGSKDDGGSGDSIHLSNTANDGHLTVTYSNNIVYDTNGLPYMFVVESECAVSGSNNLFFSTGGTSSATIDSRLTESIFSDPMFVSNGSDLHLKSSSPLTNIGAYDVGSNVIILPPQTVTIGNVQ